MKILVSGWFSFREMGATAGDLLARDLVCNWLEESGLSFDVANAPPFPGGVDWESVDPTHYTHLVFVCGPVGNGWPITDFLARFSHTRLIGLNLSLLQPLVDWNPFDVLIERDSTDYARPDLTFLTSSSKVPLVGIVLVHEQTEYQNPLHRAVEAEINALLKARAIAPVFIDTRLDVPNAGHLTTPAQVESLIARMDVVITTRLHGLVLGIKNGVPVVAIDPIAGGAKVVRQAEVLRWPAVVAADDLTPEVLAPAFDFCLTPRGRAVAQECRDQAVDLLGRYREEFLNGLGITVGKTKGR